MMRDERTDDKAVADDDKEGDDFVLYCAVMRG